MKKKLTDNIAIKLLSIFLAFFIWLFVVNVSNPEISRTKEVPLEVINEEILLAADKTYELDGKQTVTVAYDVRTLDEYKIRSTDFRAYINLEELYSVTSSVPIKVEVLSNKDLIINAVAKTSVARLTVEDVQTKPFTLVVDTMGTPEEGYAISDIVLNSKSVTVKGPISQVGLISSIGIEIDVDGLEESTSGVVQPIFYDANGNQLQVSDKITLNYSEIEYTVNISKVKVLTLDFEVDGTAAPGFQFTGVESDKKTIDVIGRLTDLASMTTITIPSEALSVDGASDDREVIINLEEFLPEGVTLLNSEDSIITVKLTVEALIERSFAVSQSQVEFIGSQEGFSYRMEPETTNITIRGLKEDLDTLNIAELQPKVDVTSFLEVGDWESTITINTSNAFAFVLSDPFTVIVESQEEGETLEEDLETSDSEEETEENLLETGAEEETLEETEEEIEETLGEVQE